jgi:nicotinate dehydrogenase subunit B
MTQLLKATRRQMLLGAGSLTLAFVIKPRLALAQDAPQLPADLRANPMLDSWIRINADGTVRLMIGKVELGQGIVTAYAQVAAEELDIDMDRLDILAGDTFEAPDQGTTAGSNSLQSGGQALRLAAAEVRHIMLELAADRLGASVDELSVEDGTITGGSGSVTYWELVTGDELHREATGTARPKAPEDYRIIGQSIGRLDIPPMMTGHPVYVHDLRPEGMLHGMVVRPPTYRARLTDIDTSRVEEMPGVMRVVRNGSFLGVITERFEQGLAAMRALEQAANWEVEDALPGSDRIFEWLQEQETTDVVQKDDERGDGGEPARVYEQTYYRPYQMHASLGTSAAVASLGDDGVMTVYTHSQSVYPTAAAIAGMLGVENDKVRLIHMQGSGCYGHNMADDAAADAALLAREVPGRPVRLQYTREQEHLWEPYGSAMVVKMTAGLKEDGDILDWTHEVWSTPHGMRPGGNPARLISAQYLDPPFDDVRIPDDPGGPPNYNSARNAIADYEFPGHRVVDRYIPQTPIRVSSTRGLGSYANIFANESFIDELAHEAGSDPVEYRLRYAQDPRARDVIEAAAERFGWESFERQRNRGRGFAFARYKNIAGYSALALEVEVTPRNGRVRVVRAVTASDVGQVVNPDGVLNQIEGGLIQMLSWTLKEEVRFDTTRISSSDWNAYPILSYSEVPPIENILIDRPGEPFLGTGEAMTGQAGAAVANAIFDATGVRYRQVPFTPDRIRQGLA